MDIFSLDAILELIDKSKSKIKKELDIKILDNDKFSLESDNLLQVLDYEPKTRYSEKEIMSSLPKIKLKEQKIEKKPSKKNLHMKLVSTPNIDIDSLALNKKNNQNLFGNKKESLEKNKENSQKKGKEDNKEANDDEEDEEYEKQFAQRQKQIEEREKKKQKLNGEKFEFYQNKSARVKNKTGNLEDIQIFEAFNDKIIKDTVIKIDVYLFNTKDKVEIKISNKDKVKDIKKQIIQILVNKKHKLKYTLVKDYKITIIESNSKINKKDKPLDDNLILYELNPKSISFTENEKHESSKEKKSNVTQKTEIKNEQVDIKINYNIDGSLHTKIIKISIEDNLKAILFIFFEQKIFEDKNLESYYFVDNKNMENVINLDTKIQNLPSNELYLYYKNNSENNENEIAFISDDENKEENEDGDEKENEDEKEQK